MPGVTISAGYGAGGSVIAPEVARQLGLPLLDRAISSHVAAQLQVSVQEAEGAVIKRSGPGRFLAVLAPLAGGALGAGTDDRHRALRANAACTASSAACASAVVARPPRDAHRRCLGDSSDA